MVHVKNSLGMRADPSLGEYDYDALFRSPYISSGREMVSSSPLVEPSPFSLSDCGNGRPIDDQGVKIISSGPSKEVSVLRHDTHGAAMLLASIKKVVTDETLEDSDDCVSTKEITHSVKKRKQVPDILYATIDKISTSTQGYGALTQTDVKIPRVRTVSVDSQFIAPHCSTFSTDALPKEQISLDLTSDQNNTVSCKQNSISSLLPQISPPSSPCLKSVNSSIDKGPRNLIRKRLSVSVKYDGEADEEEDSIPIPKKIKKKMKKKIQSTICSTALCTINETSQTIDDKQVLRKKFSWKSYPELEDFLIANREEYLRHSAMNYTTQQKEYNNRLTERLLELAADCGYVFDKKCFSFVSIRDRIRCYFKSYVQSKKKRGLILGYAARKKGLITEEDLQKSAGTKATIIVPVQKKA